MKTKNILIGATVITASALALLSARNIKTPKFATPIKPFDIDKYLGKWYEIARLDFRYEKDLNNTTAEYTMNRDGSVKVMNKGFNIKKNRWESAAGKAKFVADSDEGRLKVSFFGPFYSGYNVVSLDPEYKYAMVAGESLDYLWFLAREPLLPEEKKKEFLTLAEWIGYNTKKLVWVQHDKQNDETNNEKPLT